jgi:hypothetical protein
VPQDDVCNVWCRSAGNSIDKRNHILARDGGNGSFGPNGDQLLSDFPLAIPAPPLGSQVPLNKVLGNGCEGGLVLA